MTTVSNPTPPARRASTFMYAYGDNLMEIMEDLTAKARDFFGTLDGVVIDDTYPIRAYDLSGNKEDWQKRANGKAKYTHVTVTGPAPGFPPPLPAPIPAGFLFNTDDLRYALDVVHGGGFSEDDATGNGGTARFWYPKFEAAIRRRRAMRLVAPEATDRP